MRKLIDNISLHCTMILITFVHIVSTMYARYDFVSLKLGSICNFMVQFCFSVRSVYTCIINYMLLNGMCRRNIPIQRVLLVIMIVMRRPLVKHISRLIQQNFHQLSLWKMIKQNGNYGIQWNMSIQQRNLITGYLLKHRALSGSSIYQFLPL